MINRYVLSYRIDFNIAETVLAKPILHIHFNSILSSNNTNLDALSTIFGILNMGYIVTLKATMRLIVAVNAIHTYLNYF